MFSASNVIKYSVMRCDYCGWLNSDDAKRCVKCNQELPEHAMPMEQPVTAEPCTPAVDAASHNEFKATVKFQSKEENVEIPSNVNKVVATSCSSCGYPFASEVSVCPACGATVEPMEIDAEPEEPRPVQKVQNTKATVRDPRTVEAILAAAEQKESDSDEKRVAAVNFKQTVRDFGTTELVSETVKDDTVGTPDMAKTVADGVSDSAELSKLTVMESFDNSVSDILLNADKIVLKREDVDASNQSIDETAHVQMELENGEWYISNLSKMNNTYVLVNRKMKLEKGDIVVIGNRRYIFQ